MNSELLLLILVGFFAQLVDGALGMAFGVISTATMLALGMPPAQASALVHTAEMFTTGASGAWHIFHGNVDWRLTIRLGIAGVAGAVLRRGGPVQYRCNIHTTVRIGLPSPGRHLRSAQGAAGGAGAGAECVAHIPSGSLPAFSMQAAAVAGGRSPHRG